MAAEVREMREFTVLATSGYQGAGWQLIAITEKRATANKIATAIYSSEATRTGHIVAVCGSARPHPHLDTAYLVDTSRVRINEKHLRSRSCTVDASGWMTGDGPAADLVAIADALKAEIAA
jgi:hypothetical protein